MTGRHLRIAYGVFVALVAAWGFLQVGGPGTGRAEREDRQRVSDLDNLENRVHYFYGVEGRLPQNFADIAKVCAMSDDYRCSRSVVLPLSDYRYRKIDDTHFELCAEFTRATQGGEAPGGSFMVHPAGEACFSRRVRSE